MKWYLWAILVVAVLGLGYFSYKMFMPKKNKGGKTLSNNNGSGSGDEDNGDSGDGDSGDGDSGDGDSGDGDSGNGAPPTTQGDSNTSRLRRVG